jgi:hypothetical protein
VRARLNGELHLIEMCNLHFHYGFPLSLIERQASGDSLQHNGEFFCA